MLFYILFSTSLYSQNTWELLSELKMEEKYNKDLGFNIESPVFSDAVKKLEGSKICLSGYIFDISEDHFYLAKNETSTSFVCGRAHLNPSEIIEINKIKFKNSTKLKVGQRLEVCGNLYLSNDIIKYVPYNLKNATIKRL